jgi:hypothetical protein
MWGKRRDVWLRASHFTPEWHGGDVIDGATFATSLLHFDGVAWTTVENRHTDVGQADLVLDGTLAPAPDKTKAVDRDELATLWKQHGDGRAMPAFTRGYRAGGGEIWAIDAEGRQVGHLDRAGWTVGGRLASGNFGAVRMIGAADGWAATRRAWDHSGGSNDQHLGGPAGDALFRWDGRAWRLVRDLPERVHAMWASGADDVWAVGEKGLVMHWDGARWSEQRLTGEFRAIWGRARDDIWINGCANNFYHWNGTAWRRVPNPVPDTHWGVCPVLWGASATDVSAIGYDRSLRWNGVAWTYGPNPFKEAGGAPPHSDSSPRNDAWVAMGQHITALWGSPSGADLWAVGYEGVSPSTWGWVVVLRQNGGGWSRVPTPEIEANLMAIWGDRDDDVWAVGTKGLILHWDGTSWSKQESGVSVALTSVHGADGTVWIVGERGTILVRALGK